MFKETDDTEKFRVQEGTIGRVEKKAINGKKILSGKTQNRLERG